jgi:hypothetical protein
MRKFNLFKEIIVANKNDLVNAKNSYDEFGVDIEGRICKKPFSRNDILIFSGRGDRDISLSEMFGKNYQVVEDGERVLIKAFGAWQDIINMNVARASYDDTTADGVDRFPTQEMEEIGWHATEFNITYRTLVEILEEQCEGTLICIEQEEPYQFSGLGFIPDLYDAKVKMFAYCQNEIKRLISEDEDYELDMLNYEELDAAKFFKAI